MRTSALHLLVAVVAAALVLALVAAPAMAAAVSGGLDLAKKEGKAHGRAEGGAPRFSDVDSDYWAWRDISTMAAKGVMKGYGKGFFGPKNHVTRLEIVVLATRLMGLEDEALKLDPEVVNGILASAFPDHRSVPSWPGARECLAYALEQGYLWPLVKQVESGAFRPNSPAKRLEVIVMLLEAAGLGDEAAERSRAPILFKDASSVPSWAWGYVALAVELGVVRGSGGKLQANQPVTRAETAALLHRLDDLIETPTDRDIVTGTVVEVDISTDPAVPSTITIAPKTPGGEPGDGDEETYNLAPGVVVLLDDKAASLTAVVAGLEVALYLNEDGQVLLIDGDTGTGPPPAELTGMVLATSLDESGALERLTLWVDGEVKVCPVSPEVEITANGAEAPVSALVPGLTVRVTLVGDEVVAIAIGEEPPEETRVTGMVLATALTTDGKLASITIWHDNVAEVFTAADAVDITRDGQDVAASEIIAGLTVTLTLSDDKVVKVVIGGEPPKVTEVMGLTLATALTTDGKLASITVWHDDVAEVFTAADAVDITRDGQEVPASEIVQGLTVKLTLTDGQVTAVVINPGAEQPTTVEGTVTEVTLGTGTDPRVGATISIIPEGGAVADEETYEVDPDLTVTVNGQTATLEDVCPGDEAVLQISAQNRITAIAATYAVSEVSGDVIGVVTGDDGRLTTLTIRSGERDTTYAVDPAVKVYYGGAEVPVAEVSTGDAVTVVVVRGMITRVTITAQAG